ncbi:predicted protein [Pyrenophora tritici-repentis Pt-1C-BFP]|uniref:Uncharacterized protein n=1 Tax=Pyrenophora tritici-repentis (strain Pt-1C-BFP) TaxID=426418 RepID=B2WIK4_PYRTR|nr:uncharacterized protein PTRG_09813 [Pyrenophora tritici-repentis Pt-1C-BFP]EDU42864.1 predicted protein [Pyrenophora tritici-repentis Pt-1C-BFP]
MSSSQKQSSTSPISTSTSTSISAVVTTGYIQSVHGIHYMDEGEKDKHGNVMLASKEPCEDCGGKVVWATKGPWLMVCQMCGEPQ